METTQTANRDQTLTGQDLCAWRKGKRLSQREAATKLGMSRQYLINLERSSEPLPTIVSHALSWLIFVGRHD